eukprot:1143559-Pelagomonas_calceolata.AAC.2
MGWHCAPVEAARSRSPRCHGMKFTGCLSTELSTYALKQKTTLKNITTQLARCALCEDPPPRFESLQRRMAALVDRYVAVVKLSLNYSHETWEDSGSSDEVFKLMATPRFQALSGQSRAAGECSALDTFHAMQSFLPSPQPSTGFGKRKQGKKGKGHKKKGH